MLTWQLNGGDGFNLKSRLGYGTILAHDLHICIPLDAVEREKGCKGYLSRQSGECNVRLTAVRRDTVLIAHSRSVDHFPDQRSACCSLRHRVCRSSRPSCR